MTNVLSFLKCHLHISETASDQELIPVVHHNRIRETSDLNRLIVYYLLPIREIIFKPFQCISSNANNVLVYVVVSHD